MLLGVATACYCCFHRQLCYDSLLLSHWRRFAVSCLYCPTAVGHLLSATLCLLSVTTVRCCYPFSAAAVCCLLSAACCLLSASTVIGPYSCHAPRLPLLLFWTSWIRRQFPLPAAAAPFLLSSAFYLQSVPAAVCYLLSVRFCRCLLPTVCLSCYGRILPFCPFRFNGFCLRRALLSF